MSANIDPKHVPLPTLRQMKLLERELSTTDEASDMTVTVNDLRVRLETKQQHVEYWGERACKAEAQVEGLRAALLAADEAINPTDRIFISLHTWNNRLKEASKTIRAALSDQGRLDRP